MKKKLFALTMCLLMVMCFMPTAAFANPPADGQATDAGVTNLGSTPANATGKTIYVDANSSAGAPDGTEVSPYKTIQAAINAASNGDTVLVKAGNYNVWCPTDNPDNKDYSKAPGGTKNPHNLFIGKNITLKGEGEVNIYSLQDTTSSSFLTFIVVLISGTHGVVLDNLNIYPAYYLSTTDSDLPSITTSKINEITGKESLYVKLQQNVYPLMNYGGGTESTIENLTIRNCTIGEKEWPAYKNNSVLYLLGNNGKKESGEPNRTGISGGYLIENNTFYGSINICEDAGWNAGNLGQECIIRNNIFYDRIVMDGHRSTGNDNLYSLTTRPTITGNTFKAIRWKLTDGSDSYNYCICARDNDSSKVLTQAELEELVKNNKFEGDLADQGLGIAIGRQDYAGKTDEQAYSLIYFSSPVASITSNGVTKKYATIGDAITMAESGDEIDLLTDINTPFQITKNITIDGQGHTLKINSTTAGTIQKIDEIEGVTGEGNTKDYSGIVSVKGATATIKNLTIQGDPDAASDASLETKLSHKTRYAGVVGINANVTLEDCSVEDITYVNDLKGMQNGFGIYAAGNGKLTLKNTSVKNFNKNGIVARAGIELSIDGGTLTGRGENGQICQNGVVYSGNANIKNYTFKDLKYKADNQWTDGSVAIYQYYENDSTNASIINNVTCENVNYDLKSAGGTATVNNVNFIGKIGVKAGTVKIESGKLALDVVEKTGTISISGGTFSNDPSQYLAGSRYYTVKNESEGTWTVYRHSSSSSSSGSSSGSAVVNTTETKTDTSASGTQTTTVPETKATVAAETKTAADGTKTTTATVTEAVATQIVEKAVENKSEEVVVSAAATPVAETAAGTTTEVAIPAETVSQIAEKTTAAVTIESEAAKVTLDQEAVAAVAEAAGETGTVSLVVETKAQDENKVEVDLKIETSNGTVSDFKGGNVTVTVKLNSALAAKPVICVYIDDNGVYHKVQGQKNADGTYTFQTGHFSTYAIMAEDEANDVIAQQDSKAAELTKALKLKASSSKTKKGSIKVTLKVDADEIKDIEDLGYTVKYKFYRSTKKSSSYKAKIEGKGKTYTNTTGKTGTRYYYKARVMVYDTEGTLIAKTALKQCKYATRVR